MFGSKVIFKKKYCTCSGIVLIWVFLIYDKPYFLCLKTPQHVVFTQLSYLCATSMSVSIRVLRVRISTLDLDAIWHPGSASLHKTSVFGSRVQLPSTFCKKLNNRGEIAASPCCVCQQDIITSVGVQWAVYNRGKIRRIEARLVERDLPVSVDQLCCFFAECGISRPPRNRNVPKIACKISGFIQYQWNSTG